MQLNKNSLDCEMSSSSSSSHRQARKALAPPMFLIDFQKWTFYEVSLLCFLFVNSLASTMNHIDDTDAVVMEERERIILEQIRS